MAKMHEVALPSGAKLTFNLSPFAVSRDLYRVVVEEAKNLKVDPKAEVDVNFFKELFCTAVSSKKIEAAVWECFKKAHYNGATISEQTFEPEEARDDYLIACYEVAKGNILPFMKSLMLQYKPAFEKMRNAPA